MPAPNDHTNRPKTGVDANSQPLAVGDKVTLAGVVKSMDANGLTCVAIDSSDNIHHYDCDCHCHCCVKSG